MSNTSSGSRAFVLVLLASSFFLAGLLFDYTPALIEQEMQRQIQLATNDFLISYWSKPPIDLQTYYWLFTIANPDNFSAGAKPEIGRIGPFGFKSRIEKTIIKLSENKFRLTYNMTRTYALNESSFGPDFEVQHSFANPVYGGLMEATREKTREIDIQQASIMIGSVAKLAERFNESLLVNASARQMLLGRKVVFLERAKKLAQSFGQDTSEMPTKSTFGYIDALNATPIGPFEIWTGYRDTMSSLGDLISFEGRRRATVYQDKCNRIQASLGELRPMPLKPNQLLEIYQPQMGRILHLRPTGQRKLREGPAISYVFATEDFQAAHLNPENRCYCINSTIDNYCSLSGAIELAPVVHYAPLLFHLNNLQLDSKITNSIANWDSEWTRSSLSDHPEPDPQAQMVLLRKLGIPIKLDLTAVLFMKISRDSRFRPASAIPEVSYVPLMMQREIVAVPPQIAQILVNVESLLELTRHLKVVMYVSSLVLVAWLSGIFYRRSSTSGTIQQQAQGPPPASSAPELHTLKELNGGGDLQSQPPLPQQQLPLELSPSQLFEASSQTELLSHSSADNELKMTGSSGGGSAQRPPAIRQARIFSKVDEELAVLAGRRASRASLAAIQEFETPQQPVSTRLDRAQSPPITEEAIDLSDKPIGERQASIGTFSQTVEELGEVRREDQVEEGEQLVSGRPVANSGWFLKAFSDVARVFNGIKHSIRKAGQLDLSENQAQDRQLELLAGKIDDWYGTKKADDSLAASVVAAEDKPNDRSGSLGDRRASTPKVESEVGPEPNAGSGNGEEKIEPASSEHEEVNNDLLAESADSNQLTFHKDDTSVESGPSATQAVEVDEEEKSSAFKQLELASASNGYELADKEVSSEDQKETRDSVAQTGERQATSEEAKEETSENVAKRVVENSLQAVSNEPEVGEQGTNLAQIKLETHELSNATNDSVKIDGESRSRQLDNTIEQPTDGGQLETQSAEPSEASIELIKGQSVVTNASESRVSSGNQLQQNGIEARASKGSQTNVSMSAYAIARPQQNAALIATNG